MTGHERLKNQQLIPVTPISPKKRKKKVLVGSEVAQVNSQQ